MTRSLYLINPRSDCASYFGAEVYEHFGLEPAQGIADLATPTVAAMAPADWTVRICDEYSGPIDFDADVDFVGITGKINQGRRIREVATEFRRRGRTVIIGGPHASLWPDAVRDCADVLIVGEMEEIAEGLFQDLESGRWQDEYVAERPDVRSSPLPRWDLYPNDRTLIGCVQTSRGCPFECEFCDVIQYLGRVQRHKTIDQIVTELDQLYELGYGAVFLADDNFTVYRRRAKEVLEALVEWNNTRPDGPMALSTQVSIDAARDPEILRLCAEAGLAWVYIGIETPNEESLKETKKRQNVGVDLIGEVQRFLDHGISVAAGMIAGFDNDGPDIFQRLYDFSMASPVPFFSLGALAAPVATPLHERMEREGRLILEKDEEFSTPWETNVVPAQMSRGELFEGLRWVCNRMYRPEAFGRRLLTMIDRLGPQLGPFRHGTRRRRPRMVEAQAMSLLRRMVKRSPEDRRMWTEVNQALARKPEAGPMAMMMLFRYAQVRCLYESNDFWDAQIPEQPPAFTSRPSVAVAGSLEVGQASA